jgi:hypothetical protein
MTARGWIDKPLSCTGCGRQAYRPDNAPRTGDLKGTLTGGCKWCKGDLR